MPASWTWTAWALLCVFANLELADGVHVSELLLLAVIGLWIADDLRRAGSQVAIVATVGVLLATLTAAGLMWNPGPNARLAQELGKVVLLVAGTLALKDLPAKVFEAWTFWIPISVAALAVITYAAGVGHYYDPYRFSIPTMGSSNSLGYVVAVCLLMAHFCWQTSATSGRRLVVLATTVILGIVLLATQSRGGIVQYVVGLLVFSTRRKTLLTVLGAAVVVGLVTVPDLGTLIGRYNLLLDLQETGGSGRGRLVIWRQLLQEVFANPWHAAVGFGAGSIQLERTGREVVSAHSLLVEGLYYVGVIGTLVGLYGLVKLGRRILRVPVTERWKRLGRGLYATFVAGALVDSYALSAQLLWFTVLLLAILVVMGREPPGETTSMEGQ